MVADWVLPTPEIASVGTNTVSTESHVEHRPFKGQLQLLLLGASLMEGQRAHESVEFWIRVRIHGRQVVPDVTVLFRVMKFLKGCWRCDVV